MGEKCTAVKLEGKRFNRITVIRRADKGSDGHTRWLCRCDCGNEFFASSSNIPKQVECWECSYRTRAEKAVLQRGHTRCKEIIYIPDAGRRMLDAINEKNMSYKALTKVSGVSRSCIWNFIYNGGNITSARLARLCRAVGVSMDYVMGLKENGQC